MNMNISITAAITASNQKTKETGFYWTVMPPDKYRDHYVLTNKYDPRMKRRGHEWEFIK